MNRTAMGRKRRVGTAVVAAGLGLGVLAGCGEETAGSEVGASVGDITGEEPLEVEDAEVDAVDGFTSFVGQMVTVSAGVEEVLTPQAFVLSSPDGEGLLVIAAEPGIGQINPEDEDPVAVTGIVREAFTLTEAEEEFGFDGDEGLFGEFEREAYIVAQAVDPTVGDTGLTGDPGGERNPGTPTPAPPGN